MAKLTAEERELLQRGLQWVGFKRRKRKTKVLVRRFKSMFGEGPVAINQLFKDCQRKQPKFKEKYAFMALQWLKTYATEVDLAGRYGCCELTVEKMTKKYVRLFQSFKTSKVRFSGFDRRIYQFSCDGQNTWDVKRLIVASSTAKYSIPSFNLHVYSLRFISVPSYDAVGGWLMHWNRLPFLLSSYEVFCKGLSDIRYRPSLSQRTI